MARKAGKKEKKRVKSSIPKPVAEAKEPDSNAGEKFDFGGLPERDLKKNLGCG